MPQSHGKVWLIEKEWDNEKAGFIYTSEHNLEKAKQIVDALQQDTWIVHNVKDFPVDITPKRLKKIVIGYNTLDRANEFCEQMNKECGNCPRRAALHTKYTVLPNYITVRYRYAEQQ
jgi:hypothetical protein